jgi:hypothetical protein
VKGEEVRREGRGRSPIRVRRRFRLHAATSELWVARPRRRVSMQMPTDCHSAQQAESSVARRRRRAGSDAQSTPEPVSRRRRQHDRRRGDFPLAG